MFDAVSDEEVLATYLDEERARRDREAAFHELVTRYSRRVFGVCVRVLGSPADAEDAVQETFVKLARNAEGFRGDAKLSTWLYRVARNVCLDRIRYEARRPSIPVEDITTVADEPSVEDAAGARLVALDVQDALGQLDERSRQLLLLVAVDGLTYAEAAAVADLPVGTVKSRVSRARVRLGELLADATDDERVEPAGAPPSVGGTANDVSSDPAAPRGPPTGT